MSLSIPTGMSAGRAQRDLTGHLAPLAQRLEQPTLNRRARGSNPWWRTEEGRGFESRRSVQRWGGVAQRQSVLKPWSPVRIRPRSRGRVRLSGRATGKPHWRSQVAQPVVNWEVLGSNPGWGAGCLGHRGSGIRDDLRRQGLAPRAALDQRQCHLVLNQGVGVRFPRAVRGAEQASTRGKAARGDPPDSGSTPGRSTGNKGS